MTDVTIEKIVYKLEAAADDAVRGFEKVEKSMKDVDASIEKSNKSLVNLSATAKKAFAAAGIAISVTEIVRAAESLSKAAINATSDVQEMQSKFDAVFKQTADEAEAWSKMFSSSVGRSVYDLQEYMASFQDTFVPLGFTREEGEEFSEQLTQLTVDMASFYNTAEPDTLGDLQSAIVGNHETVRKYGIIITQATLEQELFNMGISGGIMQATEQEKVLARLNIIMNGTADAQGDAARTADSFANQSRALKGKLEEVMAVAGQEAMDDLSVTLKDFNEWGENGGYERMASGISDIAEAVASVADAGAKATEAMVDFYAVLKPITLELPEGMYAEDQLFPDSGSVSVGLGFFGLPEEEQLQLLAQAKEEMLSALETEEQITGEINAQNAALDKQKMPDYAGKRASFQTVMGVGAAKEAGLFGVYDSSQVIQGVTSEQQKIQAAQIPQSPVIPAANTNVPTFSQTQQPTQQQVDTLSKEVQGMRTEFVQALEKEPRKVDANIKMNFTIKTDMDVKKLETTIMKATSQGIYGKGAVI